MLAQHAPAPQAPRRVGVGIDTSRYGPYAVFLRDDLQPAAADLSFAESAVGSTRLRQRLQRLQEQLGSVHFVVRLDVAGPYAENLLHFLHGLGKPSDHAAEASAPFQLSLSCGDPHRHKNYRAALFGSKKSDPIQARAAARFALAEKPSPEKALSPELRRLRQVARRLQAIVRQRTRWIKQFHHLLAVTFPEWALLTKDLAAGWVLERVHRYPTAQRLAAATQIDLGNIP
jgi:hypothetical protein